MPAQTPSVGRVVHYVSHGTPPRADGSQAYAAECRAAIITEVEPHPVAADVVGLCVLNPTGQFFNRTVTHDDGHPPAGDSTERALCDGLAYGGGTWHWPARV